MESREPRLDRRRVLAVAGATAAYLVLPAALARNGQAQGAEALSDEELATLEAWCDTLLPGAARAGVADFVASELGKPPAFVLLQVRYTPWPPPYVTLYHTGVAALDAFSDLRGGARFTDLDGGVRLRLAREVADAVAVPTGTPQGWDLPSAATFLAATRADAIDVVYGTRQGLVRSGMPMVQVEPPRW